MKYFKVKTGFGKDEFISIDETELPRAFKAQVTGKVGAFKNGTVGGNHIISITPDWNKVMGYHPDYVLKGEDYAEIGSNKQCEYRDFMQFAQLAVRNELQGLPPPEQEPVRIYKGMQSLNEALKSKDL